MLSWFIGKQGLFQEQRWICQNLEAQKKGLTELVHRSLGKRSPLHALDTSKEESGMAGLILESQNKTKTKLESQQLQLGNTKKYREIMNSPFVPLPTISYSLRSQLAEGSGKFTILNPSLCILQKKRRDSQIMLLEENSNKTILLYMNKVSICHTYRNIN